jgi:hypothetical protein
MAGKSGVKLAGEHARALRSNEVNPARNAMR